MFSLGALGLSDEGVLIAGAPAFEGEFELDMMLEGRARQVARKLAERVSALRTLKIVAQAPPTRTSLPWSSTPALTTISVARH